MGNKQDITTQIEECKAARVRWQRKLNFAVGKLKRLDAKLKRLERKLSWKPERILSDPISAFDGSETIPPFLDRRDQEAAEKLKTEQAEKKRLKAIGSKARLKAQRAGDLKKMPLEGKAALAAIHGK